jgi:hypothetical protein
MAMQSKLSHFIISVWYSLCYHPRSFVTLMALEKCWMSILGHIVIEFVLETPSARFNSKQGSHFEGITFFLIQWLSRRIDGVAFPHIEGISRATLNTVENKVDNCFPYLDENPKPGGSSLSCRSLFEYGLLCQCTVNCIVTSMTKDCATTISRIHWT